MDKIFKTHHVHQLMGEYHREEISMSRFAEKLNEIADQHFKKNTSTVPID